MYAELESFVKQFLTASLMLFVSENNDSQVYGDENIVKIARARFFKQLTQCVWLYLLHSVLQDYVHSHKKQKRYLLFTPATQYGVFVTVSIPLPHPESLVSVAWFIEANYYNVDNATYFEPLLGDIGDVPTVRHQRSTKNNKNNTITRRSVYTFIETMLERHDYPGRQCLLRAICENASQFLLNGVLGDLLHLVLTPSTSMSEEDIEDFYYEAEYWGLEKKCDDYIYTCPDNPIDYISIRLDQI